MQNGNEIWRIVKRRLHLTKRGVDSLWHLFGWATQ